MRKVFDPTTGRRVHWKVLSRRNIRMVGNFIKMQLKEAFQYSLWQDSTPIQRVDFEIVVCQKELKSKSNG